MKNQQDDKRRGPLFSPRYLMYDFTKLTAALPGLLWTIYLVKTNNQGFIWTVVDITSAIPTFINVAVILILSGDYFRLLKDYKARYMNIGTVDENAVLFYEDLQA